MELAVYIQMLTMISVYFSVTAKSSNSVASKTVIHKC